MQTRDNIKNNGIGQKLSFPIKTWVIGTPQNTEFSVTGTERRYIRAPFQFTLRYSNSSYFAYQVDYSSNTQALRVVPKGHSRVLTYCDECNQQSHQRS